MIKKANHIYVIPFRFKVSLLFILSTVGVAFSQSGNLNLTKANSLFFEKDYSNALTIYKELLPVVSDSVDLSYIYSYAAICCENLDDSEQAYSNYKNAVDYKTREYSIYSKLYSLAKKRKDVACQEYVLKQRIKMFPEEENSTFSKLGDLYIRSEQFDKLLALSIRLIEKNEADCKPYYFQAIAFQKNGDEIKAEESFRKALSINPDDYASTFGLGFLIFNQASAAFEKEQVRYEAISNPIWKDYLFYLGNIKRIKARYNDAEPFLEKACRQKCNSQLEKAMEILKSRTAQIVQNENSSVNEMKMK